MSERPEHGARVGTALSWALLALACVVPTAWMWAAPGTTDVENWRAWIVNARLVGPVAGFAANGADYPPGAAWLLWLASLAGNAAGLTDPTSIRLLTATALAAAVAVVLLCWNRPGLAALTQLSFVTSAVGLLYLDVLVAPFVLAAFWTADVAATLLAPTLLLTAAVLIKWQPILIAPFAAIHLRARLSGIDRLTRRRRLLGLVAVVAAIGAVVLAIYQWQVVLAFARAGRHGGLSNFAANIPWVIGWLLRAVAPDTYGALWQRQIADITNGPRLLHGALRASSISVYGLVLWQYHRTRDASAAALGRYALAGSLAYFLLYPGAHENHLFLPALIAIALAGLDRHWTAWAAILNVLAVANLVAFYGFRGEGTRFAVGGVDATVWLAIATSAAGTICAWQAVRPGPRSDARAAVRAQPRTAPTDTGSAVR